MKNDYDIIYDALLLNLVNEAKNCVLNGRYEEAYKLAQSYEIFMSYKKVGE